MLHMENVEKVYRTAHVETHALSRFNIRVNSGEFVSVMGPSGSGKTTFLNVAGLLDTFDGGCYELDGADVSTLGDAALSRIRNTKIGFIFQTFNLIPDLDVFDNVDVPLRYRGLKAAARRAAIEEALATVGLSSRMRHRPSQLSGGQQQRVAIARALLHRPPLVLADEPTGNLDERSSTEVMSIFRELVGDAGSALLMVTHSRTMAAYMDAQWWLHDGRLSEHAFATPA